MTEPHDFTKFDSPSENKLKVILFVFKYVSMHRHTMTHGSVPDLFNPEMDLQTNQTKVLTASHNFYFIKILNYTVFLEHI